VGAWLPVYSKEIRKKV